MRCSVRTGRAPIRTALDLLTIVAGLVVFPAAQSSAAVFYDNFDDNWPYSLDLPNGIWTGTHNMSNLGGGLFDANPDGNGQLVVQNLAGQVYGWELNKSDAPLLYIDVPGSVDWTAKVTIEAQTNTTWSAAGIVVRANTGTDPGPGTLNDFVAFNSFRYHVAYGGTEDQGGVLFKRIENGAQLDDILLPGWLGVIPDGALPIQLKLERQGKTFLGYVSTDDGASWLPYGSVTVSDTSPLANPSIPVEVGLTYQTFNGTAGEARFDDFSLETVTIPEPGSCVLAALSLVGLGCVVRRRVTV